MTTDRLTTCTSKERELLDALQEADAYRRAPGPYSGSPAKHDHIKRMRLFTDSERRTLRMALSPRPDDPKPAYVGACVPHGAGMMEELEMINFDTGQGLWPGEQ